MKLLTIIIFLMSTSAFAKQLPNDELGACYLPTQSNVEYSEVATLPVASPQHVLSYGTGQFQFGELWLPTSNASGTSKSDFEFKHPLLVLIHGGCWLNSFDIRHTHALSTALAQAGYAVWSVEYRRIGDEGGGWPGSYEDIKSAIAYLPKLIDYPIDLDRVAIAGHSAGGHLALLAGADQLYNFSAVVGLAAIVDLETYSKGSNSCQTATPSFMGGSVSERPLAYQAANPAKRALPNSTILLHGTKDTIVPVKHALSTDVSNRLIEGAGHFDMIHPGTKSYQALLSELAKAFTDKRS